MNSSSDVVVIGGGPAGLYAAQLLAKSGISVQVLEEHAQIGDPVHCTGIVGREVLALPGVPADMILATPSTGRFHSPGGHCLPYDGAQGEVSVVDRGTFDRGLARAAAAAGARIAVEAPAVWLDVDRNAVTVTVQRGGGAWSMTASVCLVACGARYRFQRRLGWGVPPIFLLASQVEAAAEPWQGLDLFFRPETIPTGFAWAVPIVRNGRSLVKIGAMTETAARRVLEGVVSDLRRGGRVFETVGPVVSRLLPLAPLSRSYGDRVLAIGDAAGLVKPTTGGGIYYSLLSARWAVETVTLAFRTGDFSARTLGIYEEKWRAELRTELMVGTWFRRLAQQFTAADLDALAELALNDGLMPIVRATARFDWHHELIVKALQHPSVLRIVLRRLFTSTKTSLQTMGRS